MEPDRLSSDFWFAELRRYRRAYRDWEMEASAVVDRFRGENAAERGVNILWATLKVKRAGLFSSVPSVVAERRHKDKDDTARLAAEVVERASDVGMETNGFKSSMDKAVLDLMLGGRGTVWVQFDAESIPGEPIEAVVDDMFGHRFIDGDGEEVDPSLAVPTKDGWFTLSGTAEEQVRVDYVGYKDFAHAPESDWETVVNRGWVARRANLTRREIVDRFGKKFGDMEFKSSSSDDDDGGDDDHSEKYAEVWEIWDAVTRKRIFVAKGHEGLLEERDDPYGLEGFFPCPRPCYATVTNESLVPIPDYRAFKGLIAEYEHDSSRIKGLTEQVRVLGVYAKNAEGLANLLSSQNDFHMEPVSDQSLLEGKGLAGVADFLPLQPIREAKADLYTDREQVEKRFDEISGISDIQRGAVDPREKASQSKLKASYGAQRLGDQRGSVEIMARDAVRIMVEMMVELVPNNRLREMSGFDYFADVVELDTHVREEKWQAVSALLRRDELRKYRIDIETGSTIDQDSQVAQQERTEMLEAVSSFMLAQAPILQADPTAAELVGEMLLYMVRGRRGGRSLEVKAEEYVDRLVERAAVFEAQQVKQAEVMDLQLDLQRLQLAQERQAMVQPPPMVQPQPQPAPQPGPQGLVQ